MITTHKYIGINTYKQKHRFVQMQIDFSYNIQLCVGHWWNTIQKIYRSYLTKWQNTMTFNLL